MYDTDDIIAEAESKIAHYVKPLTLSSLEFAKELLAQNAEMSTG